jgi:hypothetical protein
MLAKYQSLLKGSSSLTKAAAELLLFIIIPGVVLFYKSMEEHVAGPT